MAMLTWLTLSLAADTVVRVPSVPPADADLSRALGHRLRELREAAGHSQEKVAQAAGISRNHVRLI
ncbi:hypothetical protein CBP52_11050 [Cellulomonas sp. PSBB021]|nr:hypothetical protein CBP52_11050 [Cellulomonas sp. PSBB021]